MFIHRDDYPRPMNSLLWARCLRVAACVVVPAIGLASGALGGERPARTQSATLDQPAAQQAAKRSARATFDSAKRLGIAPAPPAVMEGLSSKTLSNRRKLWFIKTVTPLVIHANERILRDRLRIEILKVYTDAGIELDRSEAQWLNRIARRYKLAKLDFKALLRRVDIVPPSLALAQAAEESGWGRSRFAREGNALFGQRVYRGKSGIVPKERAEGEVYRVRAFDSALHAVRAYKHNLNTHSAYEVFRRQRADMRRRWGWLDGYVLAGGLLRYSERREAYLDAIRTIMRGNGLGVLDLLQAAEPWPTGPDA